MSVRTAQPVVTALIAAGALAIGAMPGCAMHGGGMRADAAARLERMADGGAMDRQARSAPFAPGLDPELFAPIENDIATLSVDEALRRTADEPVATPAAADVTSTPSIESVMLYISGRSRRLAGDLNGALAELQAAAKADPSAPEPWREIGEVQRRLGDRLSSAAAYRQALRLDPDDLPSLLQVGQWSLERRDAASAAKHLGRARSIMGDAGDPLPPFIVDFNLGRALLELGYLRAGVALLESGLNLPEVLDSPTAFQFEVEALYRQRGDSWREAGDAAVRLGDFETALRAYQRASTLPTLDPAGLLPRFVFAAMKTGRPALASVALLDALESGSDIVGDRLLPLIQYIGANSSVGPLLRSAIEDRRAALPASERARLESLYTRAAAAALPPEQAAVALRTWLASHPNDDGAVRDLFRLVDEDLPRMVHETVRLIEAAPLNEERYAVALAQRAESLEEFFPVLEGQMAPAALMLQARLRQFSGRLEEAATLLQPVTNSRGGVAQAAAALLIELHAALGEHDKGRALLGRFAPQTTPESHLLAARSLAAIGDYDQAYETLLPALQEGGATSFRGHPNEIDALMLAAELAWRRADADAVEQLAMRAIALNPAAEGAYARLIDLYSRTGPMADQEKLLAVVRDLRQAAPSSRTLRWLRAQELMATGQYDQAERDLLSLAQEDPSEQVVQLLTTIWLSTGSGNRAEGWLRSQIEAHPTKPAPVYALARLLSEEDRAEQAAALLEEWLSRRPYDHDAARQLEGILRDKLKRVEDADRRALARLESQPATFGRALELADVLVRQGNAERAANEILNTLDSAPTMTPTLVRAFLRALFLINQSAIEGDMPLEPALRLSQIAFEDFPQLPIEIHDQHLNLLAQADASFDKTIAVLDVALARFRDRAPEVAYVTVGRLLAGNHNRLAIRIAEHAHLQVRENVDPRFLHAWLAATVREHDSGAALAAIRAITRDDRAVDVLKLYPQFPLGEPSKGRRGYAELAMVVGDLFANSEAPYEDVVALYDAAIEFDSTHETLNNNYGYYLAERGVRLDDAERMILQSLSVRPEDPFALDSLGWTRYKQGVIFDERDATGGVIREGAVTILERASALGVNRTSAEVHEHFGDALWAAGDHERAIGRWRAVQSLLEETLNQRQALLAQANQVLSRRPNPEDAGLLRQIEDIKQSVEHAEAEIERVKAKIHAAETGRQPEIAEIMAPINAPPDGG